jgi:hypothetical protein
MLDFVQSLLPSFRVTRQRNLALLASGISRVRDGHLTISEIARYIPNRCTHWSKFKRIKRFLANPRWAPEQLFDRLVRFVLSRYATGATLPVIIDQSTLDGRWEVLWASVPFRGRALPIAYRIFTYDEINQDPEGSQNKIENAFIRRLVSLLPRDPMPILLLDRGYARVDLLQLLDELDVHYVVRACKNVWVRTPDGYAGPLADIQVRPGTLRGWGDTLYHQQVRYRVRLVVTQSVEADEPWYLVTNLSRADSAVRWYERRFRCEELFRDLKDQLHLETIRLQHTERVARLLFGMVVLYHALTLIGAEAQKRGWRNKVCKDKVSLAWMALRLLAMPFILTDRALHYALFRSRWSLLYESG